jgi:LuxR family maltose regulon positive regulatory protein
VAAHHTAIMTHVVPQIINALDAAGRRIAIVLDDFHFVGARPCQQQIDFLMEHLPAMAAMVIITRAHPALRIGRLRVSGQLAEIRADRLSFDNDETSAMLEDQGIRLSETSLAKLMVRTAGWPAALYLVAC